jgi:1-aminocyclopropane-1-carboxylate deaminase/D-cysteine desulfhydrase-like pyridoxal-dependent ACC family enzyme
MNNILTPIEKYGEIFIKRDDLFEIAGVRGGKARTCWFLSRGAKGLVTAGSRMSPQVNIVAQIAKHLNIPCHIHTPTGKLSPEVQDAVNSGATLTQHKAGYNNVIKARAKEDAIKNNFTLIPFGMECEEAVNQTRKQVANIPKEVKRIIIPVGSGMSLSGVLWGLKDNNLNIPVLGIRVGAKPDDRLDKYAPKNWREMCTLVQSKYDYHKEVDNFLLDLKLDPIYEAKCESFIQPGDLFWIIGIRKTINN